MNNLQTLTNNTSTMSSSEIASLTGKLHRNIIRDIRQQIIVGIYNITDDSVLSHQQIQGVTVVKDNRGYWSEVLLDKEHSLTLVTGYDVKMRHSINKRWMELETKEKTKSLISLPTTYLDALKALVISEEQKLLLENKVKEDAPKVEFANDISETEDLITVENFAKLLGTGRNRLYRRLRIDGYLGGNPSNFNIAYQQYIDEHKQPFFKVKEKIIYVNGKSKIYKQSLITGKGQLYFQKKYNGVKI